MENLPFWIILAAVVVPLGLFLLKKAVERFIVVKAQQAASTVALDPLLQQLERGKPAIIYFTGAHCGPCKAIQAPAIQQVVKERGEGVQILKIDIEEDLATAQRWGVMKVPRTFIVDHNLHIYASNLAPTRADLLKQQLDEAEQHAATPQPMKLVGVS